MTTAADTWLTDLAFTELPRMADRGQRETASWETAAKLRAHPNQWALIRSCSSLARASSHSNAIKRGTLRAFRADEAGRFDATIRGNSVYARYVQTWDAP